jgi:hypothetical protein
MPDLIGLDINPHGRVYSRSHICRRGSLKIASCKLESDYYVLSVSDQDEYILFTLLLQYSTLLTTLLLLRFIYTLLSTAVTLSTTTTRRLKLVHLVLTLLSYSSILDLCPVLSCLLRMCSHMQPGFLDAINV